MNHDRYVLDADGSYTVRDYQDAPAFSSFLSGIAGVWGIPCWAYYVNRGQAIATFGSEDKDHCILEFSSYHLHVNRVVNEGFRTLVKWRRGNMTGVYEPFRRCVGEETSALTVRPHALEISHAHAGLGLRFDITYATVIDEPFAGLLRQVRVTNLTADPIELELLDGLPAIVPFALDFDLLKRLPFVSEGYVSVHALDERSPFIRLRTQSSDTWEMIVLEGGNFFCGADDAGVLLPAVVDPDRVFGEGGDPATAAAFLNRPGFDPAAPQGVNCQTCCGFLHHRLRLDGTADGGWSSVYGMAPRVTALTAIRTRVAAPGFAAQQLERARCQTDAIRHRLAVSGSDPRWNAYVGQTCLDNVLRGGLPLVLTDASGRQHVHHVFSRRHGDLERDYNMFRLEPSRFSRGDGNFRDVNQNRRHDVWLEPAVGDGNLRYFFNLLQLDGFNPLICRGQAFVVDDQAACRTATVATHGETVAAALSATIATPFSLGAIFAALETAGVPGVDGPRLLADLLAHTRTVDLADYGHGYWCDHWLYNFDHLESYLAIYPECLRNILIDDAVFTYFDTHVRVLPRARKHRRLPDGSIRQINAVAEDPLKRAVIAARTEDPHAVRTRHGEGAVYRCTLLQKILCLLTNKLASLSPSGLGLEMDGGRPGWHDSINGLPGIFGASVSEVIHLRAAIRWLEDALASLALPADFVQPLPVEVADLLAAVDAELDGFTGDDFGYWDHCNTAKERFRESTFAGIDGTERPLPLADLRVFLHRAGTHLDRSLARSRDDDGMFRTYYRHAITAWEPRPDDGRVGKAVRITAVMAHALPLFLEAPSHALRTGLDADPAKLYAAVRRGPLFDRELGRYLLGDSVEQEGPDVGRIWAWAPGWFENQNVFLHMEHKYLLGCLRAGLYQEFFTDLEHCALPFQDPERFGRNPLENASFIMSSRHPRPAYRGRGWQPRSSGTTAEVIEMVVHTAFGPKPFRLDDTGALTLTFAPVLPGSWFATTARTLDLRRDDGSMRTEALPAGSYAAMFLGSTLVVHRNARRGNTFGDDAVEVTGYHLRDGTGTVTRVDGPALPPQLADAVRDRAFERIDVDLG